MKWCDMIDIRKIKNGYWWDAEGKFNSIINNENSLKELTLQITDKCNMNCVKCNKVNYTFEDMKTEKIMDIIQQSIDLGLKHIHFTGGECTLHEDFPEIVKFCRENNLRVDMSSNGKFSEIKAKQFLPFMDSINISYDFIDYPPECFSFIFKYNVKVFINHMVMPANFKELKEFLNHIEKNYSKVIDIQLMPPRGNAEKFTLEEIHYFNNHILSSIGKSKYEMVNSKINTILKYEGSERGIYHELISWPCYRAKSELRVGPKGFNTCTYLYRDGEIVCGLDNTVKEAWEMCKIKCLQSPPNKEMCQFSCSPEIANFNYFIHEYLKKG